MTTNNQNSPVAGPSAPTLERLREWEKRGELVERVWGTLVEQENEIKRLTAAPTTQAAPQPAPIFGDEDHVLVPRGLLGAACSAIDKKRDGVKTLAELRRYTTGDLSKAAPAARPVLGWVRKDEDGRLGGYFYRCESHCDSAVRDDGGEKVALIAAPALPAEGVPAAHHQADFQLWCKAVGGDFALHNCGAHKKEAMTLAGMAWQAAQAAASAHPADFVVPPGTPPLTPDEARQAARNADLMRGPSDTTSSSAYAMAGALALAAKLAAAPLAPAAPAVDARDAARWRELCRLLDIAARSEEMEGAFPGNVHEAFQLGGEETARAIDASIAAQAAQGGAEDSVRYRYLRDGDWREREDLEPVIRLQLNTLWDAKIDAAIAAQAAAKGAP